MYVVVTSALPAEIIRPMILTNKKVLIIPCLRTICTSPPKSTITSSGKFNVTAKTSGVIPPRPDFRKKNAKPATLTMKHIAYKRGPNQSKSEFPCIFLAVRLVAAVSTTIKANANVRYHISVLPNSNI